MNSVLNNGNAIVNTNGPDVEITIPAKKKMSVVLSMIFGAGIWIYFGVTALQDFMSFNSSFMLIWLAVWAFIGIQTLFGFLWMVFGKEVAYTEQNVLVLEKRVFFMKLKKVYEWVHIDNFRAVEKEEPSIFTRRSSFELYSMVGGLIYFDYGKKTIKFGINIDLAEAEYLITNVLVPMCNRRR